MCTVGTKAERAIERCGQDVWVCLIKIEQSAIWWPKQSRVPLPAFFYEGGRAKKKERFMQSAQTKFSRHADVRRCGRSSLCTAATGAIDRRDR